ncbi:hypothetical protein ABZ070_07255 [Streptomyces sp. NPDC006283]|uniref:hypothetical protein n=1 Tax=Streptomyces sp. NPDC006283 TaxID=3156741 RepID=UPI0033A1C3C3
METVITVAAILAMIAVGVALIRRLDAQHGARIASYHYSDVRPGIRRRRSHKHRRPTDRGTGTENPDGDPG